MMLLQDVVVNDFRAKNIHVSYVNCISPIFIQTLDECVQSDSHILNNMYNSQVRFFCGNDHFCWKCVHTYLLVFKDNIKRIKCYPSSDEMRTRGHIQDFQLVERLLSVRGREGWAPTYNFCQILKNNNNNNNNNNDN